MVQQKLDFLSDFQTLCFRYVKYLSLLATLGAAKAF